MKKIVVTCLAATLLFACNKTEGPGGTSSITGSVKSQKYDLSEAEITEVICTPGSEIDHGDYWILNNLPGEEQFYIYYDNPTWGTDADPVLTGRTGISVEFNYSDSNVEIASNTLSEIETEASDYYTLSRNVDIVTIKHKLMGETSNADKVSSPFEVSTSNSGKDAVIEPIGPAIDEKVYLVYGDNDVFGDMERTGGNGEYIFNNLTEGSYTVYCVSTDTINGGTITVSKTIEITDKKSVVEVGEIQILN